MIGHEFIDVMLARLKIGCKKFLTNFNDKYSYDMLSQHNKIFLFKTHDIECIDSSIVAPMVIFAIHHEPWNLWPISILRVYLSKLMDLSNEKIKIKIIKPSMAHYSNWWLILSKKNETMRFIQYMQL